MDDLNTIEASESLTARARINIAISEAEKPLGAVPDKFEGVWRAGFDAGKVDGYARGLADGLRRAKRFLELEDIEQKASAARTQNIRRALGGAEETQTPQEIQRIADIQRQRVTFALPEDDDKRAERYLASLGAPGFAKAQPLDESSEA